MRVRAVAGLGQDRCMPVPASPAPEPARWYAQEVLVGGRVRLVPLQLEHAEGYTAAACSDGGVEEVYRWLGRTGYPVDVDSARAEIVTALAARARGERLPFAQLDVATGEVVGTTSYYDVLPAHRSLAIGYVQYSMTDEDWPAARERLRAALMH
jgi:RimJ/RimL family protein N-acetyltransferase